MADPVPDPEAPSLGEMAKAIVAEQLSPENLQKLATHAQNIALDVSRDAGKAAWASKDWVFEKLIETLIAVTSVPPAVVEPMVRGTIDSLLGDQPSRGPMGSDAGRRLINKLSAPPGQVKPGTEGAAQFLTLFLNESIEACLRALLVEIVTGYFPKLLNMGEGIENLQKLQDVVENALGGSRMVRRVIQPFLTASAIRPAQEFVNQQYRPELLSPSDVVRQYLRGEWTAEEMYEELARQGWSDRRIDALINAQRKFFAGADVRQFVTRGEWTSSEGLEHLRQQGYTQEEALDVIRLEGLRRIEQLEAAEATVIIGAYANRDINQAEFTRLMESAVKNTTERVLLTELGELRRGLSVRYLTPSEERRLVLAGIRSVVDYRRALERDGYQPDAVSALELELRAEQANKRADEQLRAQQAAERAAEKAKAEAERAARLAELAAEKALPSVAEVRRAFVRGHVPIDRYAAAVAAAHPGIADADVAALVADAEQDRAAQLEALERRKQAELAERDAVTSLSQLESAVVRGILTIDEYARELHDRGYDDREVSILVGVLRGEIEDRATAADKRAAAEKRAAAGGVSLNAWERAVRLGVRTLDEYADYLESIETPELGRALIVDTLRAQLAQDEQARAKRAASEAAATTRGISLERRRRAVLMGVRDLAYYARALVEAQLPVDDQRVELALLEAELAEAAAARARRLEIEAELEQRREREEAARLAREQAGESPAPATELSLSQVERAVKLGLLPPDALRDYALAKGYAADDADLLVELAVFQVPDLRDGERRREEIKTELAARRVSLDELENAVRRGIHDLAWYESELTARGYGEDDVALLSQLLEERVSIDVEALRKKVSAALEKSDTAPPLDALDAALLAGELEAGDGRAILEGAGVARDTALVYVRLLLTVGVSR